MKRLLSLLALTLVFSHAQAADDQDVAVIKTNKGEMVVEFWPDAAPKTVANFEKLAKSGFYDGTLFHRIIAGFMAQGGDPLTKDASQQASWGTGGPGYTIPAEFNDHKHVRGVLSMARTSDPDSAGSQFFLMFAPAPSLDHQYTAFGHVVKGDDVLAKIEKTPVTTSESGEPSKPTEEVKVESVRIVPASQAGL